MVVWVRRERDLLSTLVGPVDELHRLTCTPVTSRRTWLQTWLDCYPRQDLLAIGVESEGQLQGLGLLAESTGRAGRRLEACGAGPSDAVLLPSLCPRAAADLADGLSEELRHGGQPWWLTLREVVPGDQVVPSLAARLPHARLVAGDISPVLHTGGEQMLRAHVTSSHHRGISRIRNRMTREALAPQIEHVHDAATIEGVLPAVERVFRARDRDLGRRCALDVPEASMFFREVVRRHAAASQVCLTTLHLDGRLAAYVLCFLDPGVHRMWNCRFDPAWGRYSPGKLAVDESVAHALESGSTSYDFMRGTESYKDSYATERPVAQELYAASSAAGQAAITAALMARDGVRRVDARGGRGAQLVDKTRRLRNRRGWS